MTLPAIFNPYSLIGADSMEADKGAKNSAFSTNSDLFSKLLSTTGVKQVAYTGSNDKFDETLNMQDQTVAHESRMGEDSLKYEGLGLMEGDATVIESSRAPRELRSEQNDAAEGDVQEGLYQKTTNGNGKDKKGSDKAAISDTAELLALGAQSQVSAVDETRSANAAAARRASDVELLQPNLQKSRAAAIEPQSRPSETVNLKELPKSRYSTSQPRSSNQINAANQQKTGIQMTKVQEDLMSQPTSTLAAGAALAAQTDKPAKPTMETLNVPARDLDGEVRPLLANNSNIERPERQQVAKPPPAQPQNPNGGLTTPQATPPQLPAKVSQQGTISAATSARPDVGVQTGQPIADPVTGGHSTNGNGQQLQRTHQPETPRPARQPVPPREVTNQVAIQIKKAIGQGSDHIRIQLKPAELGRVEVKLEVTEDGRATAMVSAERSETLDLLQRDAAGLRQALQDAGLNTDSKSLSFNLQGEGSKFEQEMAGRGHAPRNNDQEAADTENNDEISAEESALLAAEAAALDGRVNVQV